MLVLSRKENESIVFMQDDKIIAEFTLRKIQGKRLSIAIEADDSVKIFRKELLDRKGSDVNQCQ